MNRIDRNGLKQGYWEEQDGDKLWVGNYINDKEDGVWYTMLNDVIFTKSFFKNGRRESALVFDYNVSIYCSKTIDTIHKEELYDVNIINRILYH